MYGAARQDRRATDVLKNVVVGSSKPSSALYCCSDSVSGRGAAVKYLSHNASLVVAMSIVPSPPVPGLNIQALQNNEQDDPFYAPYRKPAPPRPPEPGELLLDFVRGRGRAPLSWELRFHGESYGWEAQFFAVRESSRSSSTSFPAIPAATTRGQPAHGRSTGRRRSRNGRATTRRLRAASRSCRDWSGARRVQ